MPMVSYHKEHVMYTTHVVAPNTHAAEARVRTPHITIHHIMQGEPMGKPGWHEYLITYTTKY